MLSGFFDRLRLRFPGGDRPLVTVVRLVGVIGPVAPMQTSLTLASLERTLARAFAPKRLAAVALAINSPGGTPVQAALIHSRIRALAAEKRVPVFSFVEDVGASGGYWLACAGDELYADHSSIVGSIGVVSAGFGFPEAIRRLGIERRVYAKGDRKVLLDPFQPENPEGVARLRAIQDEIQAAFVALVRERRGDRLRGSEDELFNGDIFTGRRAKELGLVDGLGELRSVMRQRFGERVRLVPVSPRPRFRLFPLPRFDRGAAGAPLSPGDWVAGALAAAEARALWSRFGL